MVAKVRQAGPERRAQLRTVCRWRRSRAFRHGAGAGYRIHHRARPPEGSSLCGGGCGVELLRPDAWRIGRYCTKPRGCSKLSDPEWHAIGKSGADVKGRALSYLQKNSDERGAYNLGKYKTNGNILAPLVSGTDKFGAPLAGPEVYGSYISSP